VTARILHVSDLHVGAHESADVERALGALTAELRPDLVVASGDLTHRGRAAQHERAAELLRGLGPPVLAVPGNHDIPHTLPARFTRPWAGFERRWETTEPVHSAGGLHVVGVNSVRPWRHQSGGVRAAQLGRVAERLAAAPAGALRVVVLHHQLIGVPWRTRKRPVARRGRVLAALLDAGAELVLSGHTHQGAVAERHEFDVRDAPGLVLSTAPGLGQPRPHRLGEARGLVVYDADAGEIRARTFVWRGGWEPAGDRRFPRGAAPPATP
jgi:3',5'-cyclic AMP phosphodiesterase CpdA